MLKLRHNLELKGLKLKNDLFRLCLLDKQMSGDERRLLDSVHSNVMELEQYMFKIEEKKTFDELDKHNIELYIDKIEKECLTIANEDKVVTLEERAILVHIKKAVLEMKELVHSVKIVEK